MVERDFSAMCPSDCSIHVARADYESQSPLRTQLIAMIDAAPAAAASLAKADIRAICFACTSASFLHGPGSDETITERISQACGKPSTTTSTAVLKALAVLVARSVSVATPYVDWVVEAEAEFLEAAGFRVSAISGMGLERAADINAVGLPAVSDAAMAIDRPDADAVFISCTDLTAVPLIGDLERRLNKPVITSNQASFWSLCLLAGVTPPKGWGKLMAKGTK
jgi:maleate isomerase